MTTHLNWRLMRQPPAPLESATMSSAGSGRDQRGAKDAASGRMRLSAVLRRPSVVVAALVALAIVVVWGVAIVHAATPPTEDQRVYAIATQLQCPVCNGESVADAPTPIAAEMRSVIRDKVRAGWSDSQILAYFHTRYGDTILESPPLNGFTVIIWLGPLLVLLLGAFVLWTAGREWSRGARAVTASGVAAPDALAAAERGAPRGAERAALLDALRRELELDDALPLDKDVPR
jgi:cytochrome c-type biogenesis protein CcmH